ncbi:unnamed protein product [Spirodela intermedia]|uniref:Smr domain-containing protein n=1 Tax=Spirodela intermedia TaxID=51605 RepID=A0A7I8IKV0_SPIIN|nr:unnamed protein product [Spirodela intermedia]CAA6658144.1 unnamed protein product [Spirodela intermedia]
MLPYVSRHPLTGSLLRSLRHHLKPAQNTNAPIAGSLQGGGLFRRSFSGPSSSSSGGGGGAEGWAAEEVVEYLNEGGEVICSGKGFIRPVNPGKDSHFLVGDRPTPLSDGAAVAKILEVVRRWRWGPDMESNLSRLQFVPSPLQLSRAISHLLRSGGAGLLRWARRQPWYAPDDGSYSLLLDRLNSSGDFDGVQALFDDLMAESGGGAASFSGAGNRAIQYLARAGRLEVSFHCFKNLLAGGAAVETQTFNALITLFLSKGLPYKAFEIYESMGESSAALDGATYNLLVPALARSGRLDAALKLYHEMKTGGGAGLRPSLQTFSSLVDSLGKSGRLELALQVYCDMQADGHRPSAATFGSMIESFVKAGKLDAAVKLWEEMKTTGFRPNFALFTAMVEAHARSGRLGGAAALFAEMEKAGFLPTPATYASLIETHAAAGEVDAAMKLYTSMAGAGMRPGLSTYSALLSLLSSKKLPDMAGKILLEMKAAGFPADVAASDVLMGFIRGGTTELALQWLQFMGSAGVRTNNFIVDLILYTSILAHLVRCKEEGDERRLMGILATTGHPAHHFLCELFSGPERRGKPVLALVREFFHGLDMELEEGAARYFVNVLLNYLVLMGQMNRARCVWKVAYESKLFPKAIVFDQHIAWSLDVRSLSVGAALAATAHTLHRFRKRMLYYGVVPRRIKLVTGPSLRMAVAATLAALESPFEVGRVVLRAPGELVLDWFKRPIVQQFLVNEIPSKADVLLHRLDVLFPSSSPEIRSTISPPKKRPSSSSSMKNSSF